ncbi:MAG: alpha/beta hydrolase [Bacteroidota bacterium]
MYKLLKYPFLSRFMVSWRNPLSEAEKEEWTSVSVNSHSGGHIQGLFAPSYQEAAKATIVLGHPMSKDAKGFFLKKGYTDLLRKNGYHTLVFDINGFGESSHGNFSYFEDILAIGLTAQELQPELPVGYFGISLGGQWATISFADENHPYKFAIIESAASSLDEFWRKMPLTYWLLQCLNVLFPRYAKQVRMEERIKEAKHLHSLLLIYSQSDQWTPVSMGEQFKQNSAVPTELWLVEQADHAGIMESDSREAYCQKILSYLERESAACRQQCLSGNQDSA